MRRQTVKERKHIRTKDGGQESARLKPHRSWPKTAGKSGQLTQTKGAGQEYGKSHGTARQKPGEDKRARKPGNTAGKAGAAGTVRGSGKTTASQWVSCSSSTQLATSPPGTAGQRGRAGPRLPDAASPQAGGGQKKSPPARGGDIIRIKKRAGSFLLSPGLEYHRRKGA